LKKLAITVKETSLCGLGKTAPNPVLTTLRYFKDEYISHIEDKKCPSLQCSNLVDIYLNQEICLECGQCIKNCPVDAISDDFVVDNRICTRCNTCIQVCPVDAISRVKRGEING
ncbi:MAG: 4Fe-4S binding protein, partial [Halanaerobiales bacterium]|nr:4Fe-4S binding protein [Halanaerobiales bacterium]